MKWSYNQRADEVDERIALLWSQIPRPGSIVALGGYGRRELAPFSDIDIAILHHEQDSSQIAASIDGILYPLWDEGLEVGHRVRTPREALTATAQVDEATAILDGRFVCGDERLTQQVLLATSQQIQRTRSKFTQRLALASEQRWERFGACGHLLEPYIRDGKGGLRDFQVIRWLQMVWPDLEQRLTDGVVGELAHGYEQLQQIRVQFHILSKRRQDRVVLDLQDEVATALGYRSNGHPLEHPSVQSAEQSSNQLPELSGELMLRDIYKIARASAAITQQILEELTIKPPRRLVGPRRSPEQLTPNGNIVSNKRLEVVAASDPNLDPASWIQAFVDVARESATLSGRSVSMLSQRLGDTIGLDARSRAAFETLLMTANVDALEEMDRVGLLCRLIPEWLSVTCLPQRNLYHRYSVDMHLFHTLAVAVKSWRDPAPQLSREWAQVGDPMAVFYAALFHDIGKGGGIGKESDGNFPGEGHAKRGAEIATRILTRADYANELVEDVQFLITNHAMLADTATHRDTDDAKLLEELAEVMATPRRLSMLYLLTRADSLATSDNAWSTFREHLIKELKSKVEALLRGEAPIVEESQWWKTVDVDVDSPLTVDFHRTQTHEELLVVARDRVGLMADVCTVLAARYVDVHSAHAHTRADGIALETYSISARGSELSDKRKERIRNEIQSVLEGNEPPELPRRSLPIARASVFRVVFEKAENQTIIEVRAQDVPGLLAYLLSALRDSGLDVVQARIATYGIEAVDVFYVRESVSGKPLSAERQTEIAKRLHSVASRT